MSAEERKLVQALAEISTADLVRTYCSSLRPNDAETAGFSLSIRKCEDLSAAELTLCFELVKANLIDMYKNSQMGWSSRAKLREMKEKGLIYILLKPQSALGEPPADLCGFISFMVTIEEDECVLYCYELQLAENLRGRGLGKLLLYKMEEIGINIGVRKAMLTVFSANPALGFYSKFGYTRAPHSPEPKILRNGIVKAPSYYILERRLG